MNVVGPVDVVRTLHGVGARVLVVFAVVLALWSTYHYIRNKGLPHAFRVSYLTLLGLTALQGLLGVTDFLLGGRPTELVHVAYGVFALIFLPGAYISSRPGPNRNETLVLAIACWVVCVVYVRGIVTG